MRRALIRPCGQLLGSMPALGEREEKEERPEINNGVTEEAERVPQVVDGTSPLEGAHSDEQRSHCSDSDEGSKGGSRTLPPLLGDFDVLRFKNRFLEAVEELRIRRVIESENEERIKSLVTEKHDLLQKIEEEHTNHEAEIEGYTHSEQELRKSYDEQLKQAEDELSRNKLVAESKEQEAKALKDEIRSLHLTKYNLEKKVQEQERQLHLQSSSRENYLLQVNQLEQNFLSVSKQVNEVTEQMEWLESNVKQAKELHKKLEYVNEHQNCELKQRDQKLEQCRRELVEARVKLNSQKEGSQPGGEVAKDECSKQDFRMQINLNQQLQEQLSALREEHRSLIEQLKEAHSLVDRHVESSVKHSAAEVIMEEQVRKLRETNEDLQQKLTSTKQLHKMTVENHSKETADFNEKLCDMQQRLKTLQADYAALQASHEQLEEDKLAGERGVKVIKGDLEMIKSELKKAASEILRLKADKESLNEELRRLKLTLEHQLLNQEGTAEEPMESEGTEQKKPQSLLLPSQKTAVKLEDCQGLAEVVSEADSVVAQPPSPKSRSISPVMSPDIIIVSPTPQPTDSKSLPATSPGRRETEDVSEKAGTTNGGNQDLMGALIKSPQDDDILLADTSSTMALSNGKRTVKFDCEEDTRQLSLGKQPKLDLAGESNPQNVTKVTESPVNLDLVKDEPISDNKVCTDNAGQSVSNEQMQLKDIKLGWEDTDNKTNSKDKDLKNKRDQTVASSQSQPLSKDKTHLSQAVGKETHDQHELPQRKDSEHDDEVMFSDEEDEGGAGNSHMSREFISSQMNRQIDRVQLFLKLERLKRPKT